jgi:hypothetical protein
VLQRLSSKQAMSFVRVSTRDKMTDVPDAFEDVDLIRFSPTNWNPDLGDYLNDFLPRMVRVAGTTISALRDSLKNPDYEYRFQATKGEPERKHPLPGIRMVSHQFGEWIIFTVWDEREYVYHATVQLQNGMALEEAAFAIYLRWLETRPKDGGEFGTGKSRRWVN